MKKQFQSKSVPRGTRTIWRYLGALFLLFSLSIGQMWGAINNTTVTKAGGSQKYIDVTTTAASNGDEVTVAKQYIAYTMNELISSAIKDVWYTQSSGTSGSSNSDAVAITGYRTACNRYIPISSSKKYTHYVTNCVSFSALYDPRSSGRYCTITATNVDDAEDVLTITNSGTVSSGTKYNVELTGLSASKYYRVVVETNNGSDSRIYQIRLGALVNSDGPFAVTYDKNNEGASGTMTDANSPYVKNASVTVLGNSFTAPTGMVFAGWNTKANGSGTSYAAGNTFNATEDVTLFAQWAYPATGTGTITYTLTKGKADVSAEVSGVSTLSSSSTAFSVSTLAIGSDNKKDGYSGQITGHAADYSASQYVALQFTVADGYTFTPSAVSMKVYANSTSNMKMKLVFTDGVTSVESEELACSSSADSDIEFASGAFTGKKFVGNVDVVLYQWGVTSKRTYVKSPVTITGTVAAAAPKYDVIFANGGEGTGDMATLKYEAGEEVTLPACGYTPVSGREFDGWTSSDVTISAGKFTMPSKNVTITATWRDEAVKYTVTYDVNGGSSATPTETDKAAGDEFALAAAPEYEGYHFEGWLCDADAMTYDAEDAYTMTAANTKFTAQWKPYSTISIANKTYIIGIGDFNAVSDFSSNCEAAVSYELKESYSGVTLTPAGVFSATAAGEYIVVANQAGDATYAATSKEFTVTVLDNELSDTYVWKKGTGYTGCVANPNADAPAAQYTDIAYEGFTGMGRAAADNTECILTFTVKAAYSANFGIKSICTYGKLEEPAGGQISWDGGANWEDLAAYSEGKKEFNAPAATFPTSFKIRFLGVSASSGGLYWRNALVTLEAKKTVASTVVTLNNVMVNTEAISSANLNSLLENKSLDITTEYAAAPTVTFVKRTTVNYEGGWAADVTDEEIDVTASDASTVWSASQEIGENTYTITLAKPSEPSLETLATGVTLSSAKIATDEQSFTFSGLNLEHSVAISLESEVAGMSVSPAVVIPTDGAITDQEVTITYKSLENVAEANVNLIVSYSETVKLTIPLTYSSTQGFEELTSISAATTWDWNGAASAAVGTVIDKDQMIILANADVTWDENFYARAIAGKLEYMCRENKFAQGGELKFNTTVAGKVYVKYSNTGGNAARTVNVNGTKGSQSSAGAGTDEQKREGFLVSAGDVLIKGVQVSDDAAKYLRVYKVDFLPTHTLSFAEAGEVEPMTVAETEKAVLPEPATVPSGMSFIGWYLGEDKVGDAGDEYTMGTADVELTAKFSAPAETPVINAQPESSAYCAGSEPTLTVGVNAVSDGGTLHYAWFKVGEPDAAVGTDAASYTVESAGTYYVKVTNSKAGSADATVTSENAVVTLNAGAEITAQPAALQVVDAGDAVELSVTATNATAYQWYKGGVLIEGAQAATYNFTAAVGAATYYCVVTGACGDVQSNNAVVYVESGDCNTIGYDGTDNTFGTSGTEYTVGSYTKYKYSKSANTYTIDEVSVTAYKLDGKFYFWTPNTEIAAISTSVLTDGTTPLRYCVVFYDEAKFEPADEHIISVVEETAGLKNAAQKINVTVAPAGAKCARVVRSITWNETNYGQGGNNYIYAARVCAIVPAEKPVISGDLSDLAVCTFGSEDLSVTVDVVSDGGTLSYQWYNADGDVAITGEESASYTPMAEGSYYVIVTNTIANAPSSSTKSATAEVTQKTATAITGFVNAAGAVGAAKTLSVTAVGAGLTYQWQACDENGNVTDPAVLGTEATYGVTITAEPQYYLVTVHGDCGNQTQVLFAEEWHEVERANVTGSRTWDWSTAGMGEVALVSGSVEYLMANVSSAVPNTEAFRSDMLLLTGNYANRGSSNRFFQGWQIRFYTEVPGKVSLNCRAIHGTMTISINGTVIDDAKGSDMSNATAPFFVQPGWVTIVMDNQSSGYEGEACRINKIVFDATPDYTRDVTEGKYGTICLPNGGVMVGATLYEVAYYGATSKKIFFDEILNGEMEAGVPYIFLPNEGADKLAVFYTDEANASAGSRNGLIGYIGASEDPSDAAPVPAGVGNYILNNNQYREVVYENSAYVLSHRAYIKLADINPTEPALAPGRRRISMNVQQAEVATGMDNLYNGEQPMKVMIDGQMYILRGEKMYDATGRLVK